jgi:predicted RNA-binding Zn ribbon-like protein
MTGQPSFDSHVLNLVDVAARLVNELTVSADNATGESADRRAAARALRVDEISAADALALTEAAISMRQAFEAVARNDLVTAATVVNDLMAATGARPRLDPIPGDDGWHVHFHGRDDSVAVGWAAGCATGLALAIGSGLAGRLGICAASRCERVYVDVSRNSSKRFCSLACQNRTKAAAFRDRNGA